MEFIKVSVLLVVTLFLCIDASASVVKVETNNQVGQGFLIAIKGECTLLTPKHVVKGANTISVLTATRETFQAEIIELFETVDFAKLSTNVPYWQCQNASLQTKTSLSTLLSVYDSGTVKTMVEDGSLKQITVQITRVDDTEFLEIIPVDSADNLKQGQSGSMLYVAGEPAGLLIELYEGKGLIYRVEAMEGLVFKNPSLSEKDAPKTSIAKDESRIEISDHINTELTVNKSRTFTIQLEENSPVLFENIKTDKYVRFQVQVLDAANLPVYTFQLDSNRGAFVPFTPKSTAVYTIKLKGLKKEGKASIKVNQWTLNSDLKSPTNVVAVGNTVTNKLAPGAVSSHKVKLYKNSPILLKNIATSGNLRYRLKISDKNGSQIFSKQYDSNRNETVSFTPPISDVFSISMHGAKGYGEANVSLTQWALDSELTGEANATSIGSVISNKLAPQTISSHKIKLYDNSPIQLHNIQQASYIRYYLKVYDELGAEVFSQQFDSNREGFVAFTPKGTGIYNISMQGSKGYSLAKVKINQWALDSELRGDANVVNVGSLISNKLAARTVAEYKIKLYKNSPIEFQNIKTSGYVRFNLVVLDANSSQKFSQQFDSNRAAKVGFTPQSTAVHTIRFQGVKRHSDFKVQVNQWALDSELTGASNIVAVGERIENKLATGAVALYKIKLKADQALQFLNIKADDFVRFRLIVLDQNGKQVLSKQIDSSRETKVSFTPTQSNEHTIKIQGIKDYGTFKIHIGGA